jgi:hypothetical protein
VAQPLRTINLIAPGFKGVNTEDSPIALDATFAEKANNAVIDQRGRIAARKGNKVTTTDKTELGADYLHQIHYFYDNVGNTKVFSTGNNKILSGTTTLVDETPAAYAIANNNWKIVNFNEACYFFQKNQEPLVYSSSLGAVTTFTAAGASFTAAQHCNEAIGAYGRLWVTGTDTDKNTIYWSDLLDGIDFQGGSSGSINVQKAWPDGFDEIEAIAAHNNLLIIFGKHSILVYGGANSPATMSLVDTVSGVGCVDRNSVQITGTDVLFLSYSGLRSFGRTIQEKSLPISDLSRNVKQKIVELIDSTATPVISVYSPENSFYLLSFVDAKTVFCFDVRGKLENGSFRTTVWPSAPFTAFERTTEGTLYVGSLEGLGEYSGYYDNNLTYRFEYSSPELAFGDSSKLKMLKKIRPTIVGGVQAAVLVNWAYDFETSNSSFAYALESDQAVSFFGEGEYGIANFSTNFTVSRKSINGTGSGNLIRVGITADIKGTEFSVQEINVLALIGKTT